MPHSSGGGSSHSGSHHSSSHHSSSHHSSGGGSSHSSSVRRTGARHKTPHTSLASSYRPGRHVFVRYDNGMPSYCYSDYSYGVAKRGGTGKLILRIILVLIAIPLFIIMIPIIRIGLSEPAPITSSLTPCTIIDETDAFSDDEERSIQEAVSRYYDKTGIAVEIHTISEETFVASDKEDLETYAYYDYVNSFDDENHWLIVFLDEDRETRTWEFEGIQGDYTDEWLTKSLVDDFDDTLTENLWKTNLSYGEAFTLSFDALNDATHRSSDWRVLLIAAAFGIAGVVLLILAFRPAAEKKQLNGYHEVNVGNQGPVLVRCDYCGGTYVYGETVCPHCSAPGKLRPEG